MPLKTIPDQSFKDPYMRIQINFFFFLTVLLTITHVKYSKLNSQEKKLNICAK